MATDAALLGRAVSGGLEGPLLRIYSWDRPSLSTGLHQRVSPALHDRCAALGVPVVRRPTGGTAVLHHGDLTYSVVARHGGAGVLDTYRRVAACLIRGLRAIGVEAQVGTRRRQAPPLRLEADSSCFAGTLGADLEAGGRKICGSAQVRQRDWFLQHGSIPIADPSALLGRILGPPGEQTFTWIDALRPATSFEELAGALVDGFEAGWGRAVPVTVEEVLTGPSTQCLPNPLVTL